VGTHDAPRVAIACGHTGGHVYPALAVAAEYRARRPGATIVLVGPEEGPGPGLANAAGIRWRAVAAEPFFRVPLARRALAVTGFARATLAGRRVLRDEGVELVLGLGSYATAGVVVAARTLGLATVVHEANAVAGLANRLLGRLVDRVLLGFPDAAGDFPDGRCVVTGTPVRAALRAVGDMAHSPVQGRALRLLVTGGSGGSPFLDAAVPGVVERLAGRGVATEVLHQAKAVEPTRAAYARTAARADVRPFIDDIAAAYAWADHAITCAGAVTLAELGAVRLPALVVPLGAAALDHQTANARACAAVTGIRWTSEREFDADRVAGELAEMALSGALSGTRAGRSADAATAVVDACEDVLAAWRRRRVSGGAPRLPGSERPATPSR
jgi:UDP-N-acetylglucosamine--N-acetylmuramyl-(pentapeptide) pyrophosphoryl-undecaprenol N-acetylglucosamine transferase